MDAEYDSDHNEPPEPFTNWDDLEQVLEDTAYCCDCCNSDCECSTCCSDSDSIDRSWNADWDYDDDDE